MTTTTSGFLVCRSMMHAWDITAFRHATDEDLEGVRRHGYKQIIKREARCLRCETERIEYFGRYKPRTLESFSLFIRRYRYPNGYLFHQDGFADRPTRADYTTALFSQFYDNR